MKRACFLDRDGVVNVEVDYLHDPAKAVLENGIVEALKLLNERNIPALVVTNQAGVAKGLYAESDIALVHARLSELLAAHGVRVDDFFYCPHHPDFTGPCQCRKPLPGLLLRAAAQYGVDPAASIMIGDRESDIRAGLAAGCGHCYLVATGYGCQVKPFDAGPRVSRVADAAAAVRDWLACN